MFKSLRKQQGFWEFVIPAAASLIGSALSSESSKDVAEDNRSTSIELANSAHQREVADLKAAGLNPILSVNKSGAPMPSFQMPTFDYGGHSAAQAGLEGWRAKQEIEKSKQEVKNLEQAYRKNEPIAQIGDVASKAITGVTEAVPKAIEGLTDIIERVLSPETNSIRSQVESGMSSAAGAVKGGIERLGDIGSRIGDVVTNPGYYARQGVNSAKKMVDDVRQAERDRGAFVKALGNPEDIARRSKFSNDHRKNLEDISKIYNPVERAHVRQVYRHWMYQNNFR